MRFPGKKLGLAYMALLGAIGLSTGIPSAMADTEALGDLAIVPYYNVRDDFNSGLHIINSSASDTVAVKVRYRDARYSHEVLDFIVVLSPNDEWVGSASVNGDGLLQVMTRDTSCTVPQVEGRNPASVIGDQPGYLVAGHAPGLPVAEFGHDGYIEVIGMGATSANVLSNAALHVEGGATSDKVANGTGLPMNVPQDCDLVEEAFSAGGVLDSETSEVFNDNLALGPLGLTEIDWDDVGNWLKVSYLIRQTQNGIEMGDNAAHIRSFASRALISAQAPGQDAYPDLDGGNPLLDNTVTGLFENVFEQINGHRILNDWSYNVDNGVSTDWVVTFPGVYLGFGLFDPVFGDIPGTGADFSARLPGRVVASIYDREEFRNQPVTSPAADQILRYEVNLIHWGPEPAAGGSPGIFTTAPEYINTTGPGGLPVPTLTGDDISVRIDPNDVGIDALPYGWANFEFQGIQRRIKMESGYFAEQTLAVLANTFWARDTGEPDVNYARVIRHTRIEERFTCMPPIPC